VPWFVGWNRFEALRFVSLCGGEPADELIDGITALGWCWLIGGLP